MTGFVYAIAADNGLVKIGYSEKPELRLTKINSDTSSPCRLIGYIAATREHEAALHQMLAPSSVNGEWYRRDTPVQVFVDLVTGRGRAAAKVVHILKSHPLYVFRKTAGLSLKALADRIGTTKQTLCRLECYRASPSAALARRIKEATAGAVTMDDLAAREPNKSEAA